MNGLVGISLGKTQRHTFNYSSVYSDYIFFLSNLATKLSGVKESDKMTWEMES